MKSVRAHVQNGQIVLDEVVDLIDGTDVEVLIPAQEATIDEMSIEERAEFEAALEESVEQLARGEFDDARSFALRLLARS